MRVWPGMILVLALMVCACGGPASAAGASSWEELAAQWLETAFHQPGGRWAATVLAAPPGWELSPAYPVTILGVARGVNKPKKIMALALFRKDGKRGELWVKTVCLCRVPVTCRVLTRSQDLAAGDWQWEERDATELPPDVIREEKDLTNKRLKQVLAAQEAICAHALEPKPDVARGQRMTLRVLAEGVVVSADAEAMEEGTIGREIKIRIIGNGKILTASVASNEAAELALNDGR